MTLDKKAMVSSGQIMYDTLNSTMRRGNSCATLDRMDRKQTKPDISMEAKYTGPVDYTTREFNDWLILIIETCQEIFPLAVMVEARRWLL